MRTIVGLATLMVASFACAADALHSEASTREIQVAGVGEVVTVPDMATVTISVTERDRDANAAQASVNRVTAAVLEAVAEQGVAERDVTATVIQLHPIYARSRGGSDPQTIEAFQSSRTISVRVRDLGKLGDVLNGALERGVNGIQQIQLDTSERTELEREALDLAIDDAKREAQQIAKRFGVTLGNLTHASTAQAQQQPVFGRVSMAVREDMPFSPGELTVSREVLATFSISD